MIARFGTLGKVEKPFLLRSDNDLVFTSRSFTALVRSYRLRQEFITPHCPQQNGMVERVIRTLKEQCVHRQRFETLQHANRVISDWIGFYNQRRPHQALGMKTPAQTYQSWKKAAGSVQKPLDHYNLSQLEKEHVVIAQFFSKAAAGLAGIWQLGSALFITGRVAATELNYKYSE